MLGGASKVRRTTSDGGASNPSFKSTNVEEANQEANLNGSSQEGVSVDASQTLRSVGCRV